jgi:hypothetical protein
MPGLFQTYLPVAVAGAARQQAAAVGSSDPLDPLGLGPAGGWPGIPASGPGGAGWAGPGSGQAPWPVSRAGFGGSGLSSDPGLRPTFGAAPGGLFDPYRAAPGLQGPDSAATIARVPGAVGSAAGSGTAAAAAAAGAGSLLTPGEISAYFNPGPAPTDDDTFVIAEWIGPGKNPFLLTEQLGYARQLHSGVILPCCRYYKNIIYGDPDYRVRLGQVVFGIVSADVLYRGLRVGPTSRHLLGQAVNFAINGVADRRVVDDIDAGLIQVTVGTYGEVNGIHASLPFTTNGVRIEHMRLRSNTGVPGFVGYSFRQQGAAA